MNNKSFNDIIDKVKNLEEDTTNCIVTSEYFICLTKGKYEGHSYINDINSIDELKKIIEESNEKKENSIYRISINISAIIEIIPGRKRKSQVFNHAFIIFQGDDSFKIYDAWDAVHKFTCWKDFNYEGMITWLDHLNLLFNTTIEEKIFNGPVWNNLFELTNEKWKKSLEFLKAKGEYTSRLPMFKTIRILKDITPKVVIEKVTGFNVN